MDNKSIIETVGLVALVLSIVFLAYELKRGNDIAEAEAAATVLGDTNELVALLITDDDAARVWAQGLMDHGAQEPKDKVKFRRLLNYALNIAEINIKFIQNGMVDPEYIEYYAEDMCSLIESNDGVIAHWNRIKKDRVSTLVDFIDLHCDLDLDSGTVDG